jgi:4-hydroxy-tetrahydrodipicolinate reductase
VGTRRLPLQKKVGTGMTKAAFSEQLATGKFGHIGMRESVALIAGALDCKVHRIDQSVEPVFAVEDLETQWLTVDARLSAGDWPPRRRHVRCRASPVPGCPDCRP